MRTKMKMSLCLLCFSVFLFANALHAEPAGMMDLVGNLTNQLGVSESQATGGAGFLFQMAKNSLTESEFGKVSAALPGVESVIQAAPEVSAASGGLSGKMGGVSEGLGSLKKTADTVNQLSMVKDQFAKLGLDESMVSKFVPIILEYANTKGGETVMNLLKGVWQ